MAKFTLRQKKFIELYDGNGTQAAIKAGYSKKSAYSTANEILRIPEVLKAIEERTDKKTEKAICTREELQLFWREVMQKEDASISDRLRASELLGKSMAAFVERHEHDHKGEIAIAVKHVDLEDRIESLLQSRN